MYNEKLDYILIKTKPIDVKKNKNIDFKTSSSMRE